MNRKKNKNKELSANDYFKQDVYVPPSNRYIAISLTIALIFNFLPLQEELLIFRPDLVAITIIYWVINYPHKMGMSIAFGMGLMMDVSNASILGQHALAYCIAVYLALVLGRRLRIFNLMQQAPQVGLILLVMQIAIILVGISGGAHLPGWHYLFASITGTLLWVPISLLISTPLKQKSELDAL